MWNADDRKIHRDRKYVSACQAAGRQAAGDRYHWECSRTDGGDSRTTLWWCKSCRIVHFKWVNYVFINSVLIKLVYYKNANKQGDQSDAVIHEIPATWELWREAQSNETWHWRELVLSRRRTLSFCTAVPRRGSLQMLPCVQGCSWKQGRMCSGDRLAALKNQGLVFCCVMLFKFSDFFISSLAR